MYLQPDNLFTLDKDANNESTGYVLSQNTNGQEYLIAYWGKYLCKPERNYCTSRKIILAIMKAVEHFHHYLNGRKFLPQTDHVSLTLFFNLKNPQEQIARWIQNIQEYDFEIHHHRETLYGNGDVLSRKLCF